MTPYKKIRELEAIIVELRAENALLREQIALLRKELYGRQSEKIPDPSSQPLPIDAPANPVGSDEKKPDTEAQKHAKELVRNARKAMREADAAANPKQLKKKKASIQQEVTRHRVPEGMICASCQGRVKDQGLAHRADELDLAVHQYVSREYLLHRGECPCGEVSFVMPGPARGLEKTTYSPRFIAQVIIDKFRFHFPVHRQEKYLAEQGIYIHRQVLNDLVLRAWRLFEPVVNRMWEINRQEKIVQCDETPIRVVLEESKDYFLWCLLSQRAITFKMTEKRNQVEAAKIIGAAEGVVTDGHSAYRGEVISGEHSMCLAHCRRLFFSSILSYPTDSIAALNLFRDIYLVEGMARDDQLDAQQRLALREKLSIPLLEKLRTLVASLNPPPRSTLGKAKNYTLKHWQKLTAFTRDGRLAIDNNAVEREFKEVKLGLKNFLFAQSEIGCDALAGYYSLIATLKVLGHNLQDYFADVLVKLESGWPQSRIDELLPWNWQPPTKQASEPRPHYQEVTMSLEELIKRRNLEGKVIIQKQPRPAIADPPANSAPL